MGSALPRILNSIRAGLGGYRALSSRSVEAISALPIASTVSE